MANDRAKLLEFARGYAAAWCSQEAARVAACYAIDGTLCINGGVPAVGRTAITETAREFMSAFPDMQVLMDDLVMQGEGAVFRWTLVGTNTGPGGKGQRVRISGFEVWKISEDGMIAESQGSFDAAEYQRQIERGCG